MAKQPTWRHEIKISLRSASVLTKADSALLVEIRDEGNLLGNLEIGRGSVIWWARGKRSGKRINWERFVRAMDEATGHPVRTTRQAGK